MSSASNDRYQSRLFNFLHQQSRRWGEGVQRTFRHLQVATNWSLQAVLYPIYLLIQRAVETADKQLHSQESPQKQQLKAADTPIQLVLQTVESLPLTSKPQLQGIAAQLSNRHLVLVTPSNDTLDIFTKEQQELLEARILTEVASYWQKIQVKEQTETLPEIYRILNKLTNPNQSREIAEVSSSKGELVLLDTAIAFLESKTLTPISRLRERIPNHFQIQDLIWAAVNYFFGNRQPATLNPGEFSSSTPQLPSADLAEGAWLTTQYLFGNGQHAISHTSQTTSEVATNKNKAGNILLQTTSSSMEWQQQTTQVEAKPDWIETKAKFIGYDKHPLEQILEWLDRLMVILEQAIAKIVHFCQGCLNHFKSN